MNKFIKLSLLSGAIAAVASLSGCASIFGDNTRAVSVNSQPEGATILIDNVQYGVTPATVTLPSYIFGGKVVTLRKAGYPDTTTMVNSVFQPIGLLNIIFGVGFLVDAATGNTVKIDPKDLKLNVTLSSGN